MKKLLLLTLSLIMLVTAVTAPTFTAKADDVEYTTMSTNGTWYEGYISDYNTVDYYKFTIPSDGTVTIKLMRYMNIKYRIYNYDLSNLIGSYDHYNGASSNSPATETYEHSLSKGTYFIKLEKYYDNGKFKVSSNFKSYGTNETEPNDFEHATSLAVGNEITGCFTYQDDVDWYKIYVPDNCNVKIKLKRYMNIKYRIYNYDLSNQIDSYDHYSGASSNSPATETYEYSLSKGTYFIRLEKYYDSGKYTLSWNLNIKVSKPKDFRVSNRKTTSLDLAWSKPSGVNGFELQQYKNKKWSTIKNANVTSHTVKNLKAGTFYNFRIRAYKTVGGKKYYSGWKELGACTKPSTVSLSSVKASKGKKITVKWKKTTCTGYQIQYSTSSKFKNAKSVTVNKSGTTSKTISKLKAKKKYYVRVRAYKTVDGKKYYGSWSKVKSVTVKK